MAVALALLACGHDETALEIPEGCNPVASEHDCMLPYPSDFFRDAAGAVTLTDPAQLRGTEGEIIDFLALHPSDGFSSGTQILALFRQGIDDEPLVGATDDATLSLEDDSPTVVLNAHTGARVLHLAELDPRALSDDRRGLLIRPLERLEDGQRYVVAIRGLRDPSGQPLPAPLAFARVRDGDYAHPALADLGRYEADVFAPLAAAGVARSELQLAWDFTVRSRNNAIGDMLAVREQLIAYFESTPAHIEIISVSEQPQEHQYRRIEATVDVPLFMESPDPMAALRRDADGVVVSEGTVAVPFAVIIPTSVGTRALGAAPARLMQFGHGFFGGRDEIDGVIDQLADERSFVVVAADWWGMSEQDRLEVVDTIVVEPARALVFTDRVHQAMANFMAVAYAASGPLATLDELQIDDDPTYDADTLYYYGISQGGILGGTYLALSPHIERGVLSVSGADLSLMMFRARPFVAFLLFIAQHLPDQLDQQKFALLSQTSFDRIDPWTYAPDVSPKHVLMQIGIGDDQVPNLASHAHARALGIPHLQPSPRSIAGLAASDGPLDSAIVEFDFGVDPLPGATAVPPTSTNDVHEGVRRLEAAKEQLHRFFQPNGRVEHTCEGNCDPE